MITYPVGNFLTNFEAAEPTPGFAPLVPDRPERAAKPDMMPLVEEKFEPAGPDPAVLAREEGYREGRAAAQAEYEAIIAQQSAEYFQKLTEERQKWVSEEGDSLSGKLNEAIANLAEQLSTNVDSVLRPFIVSALRKQMIDELAQSVDVLLSGGDEHRPIVISGSEDLLETLRSKLTTTPTIEFQPNDSPDLKIVVDDTIVQSQLQTWIERFNASEE